MPKYNGHKNWNHWNVSLWLFNDEHTYNHIMHLVHTCTTKDQAAHAMLWALRCWQTADHCDPEFACPVPYTPDGAPYTFTSIRAALTGLR